MWSDAPSGGRSCGSERRDTAFRPCGIADAGPAGLKREIKEVKNILFTKASEFLVAELALFWFAGRVLRSVDL